MQCDSNEEVEAGSSSEIAPTELTDFGELLHPHRSVTKQLAVSYAGHGFQGAKSSQTLCTAVDISHATRNNFSDLATAFLITISC